ncbi:hypothetical protein DEO23_09355 [Brachybacterium endophyticum]|uniref:Secreted protein n=1 Tax=Brachybacterium endophyticum TaxID=2182385 RepID=A0A2U2RJH2_9MICO|nr:PQQ-binding-like beta-propeller repeat protein [Brachybacterium endophyticum]PWH06018.1 hypothetical protein DEO23_09355 [Brachybacterium endophyticum]
MTHSGTILTKRRRRGYLAASVSAAMLALSGCGAGDGDSASDGEESRKSSSAAASSRTEVGALTPRIVLAHDGGVTTLDSSDGEVVDETDVGGYARLNPAGDGRTVMVSAGSTITPYDTGLIARAHGDHFHYYTQDPTQLPEAAISAEEPGHVVPHGDRTATFADGTGQITVFDPSSLAEGTLGKTVGTRTDAPHHGVAVPLSDGSLLHTVGTEEDRHAVVVEDAEGTVTAKTEDCPGVHGEAAAKATGGGGDVITLGCENGPVMYKDGAFHKIDVTEDFQRSGNQKGHDDSPVVLTDYKVEKDPEGGIERPTTVGLLDTRDGSFDTVDLGSEYWFRSLDRGPDGEALVLTADGELNILDPESGKVLHETTVAEKWTEPDQWQEPGPMLSVADGTAFVVDPENKKLTMVDIETGEAYEELDLPEVPHEIEVTTGTPSGEYEVTSGSP